MLDSVPRAEHDTEVARLHAFAMAAAERIAAASEVLSVLAEKKKKQPAQCEPAVEYDTEGRPY